MNINFLAIEHLEGMCICIQNKSVSIFFSQPQHSLISIDNFIDFAIDQQTLEEEKKWWGNKI